MQQNLVDLVSSLGLVRHTILDCLEPYLWVKLLSVGKCFEDIIDERTFGDIIARMTEKYEEKKALLEKKPPSRLGLNVIKVCKNEVEYYSERVKLVLEFRRDLYIRHSILLCFVQRNGFCVDNTAGFREMVKKEWHSLIFGDMYRSVEFGNLDNFDFN